MMETNLKLKLAPRLQILVVPVLACLPLCISTSSASGFSLAANQQIQLRGNNIASDSYDSADPNYSIFRQYPFGYQERTKANGDICAGTSVDIANARIKGTVRIGPGTNTIYIGLNGAVGDRAWVEGGNNGIETGHSSTDFNANFPSVVLPEGPWVPLTSGSFPWTNGITYQYVVATGGSWSLAGLSGNLLVNAPPDSFVKLYITGTVILTGFRVITLAPTGAQVRVYMGGQTFDLSGSAFIDNQSGIPENFCLYGSTSCTNLSFGSSLPFCGCIYAPQADFNLGGGGNHTIDFVGSSVSKVVTVNGHYSFHFDEDLDRNPLFPPRIISEPHSQTVLAENNAAFSVAAQWATNLQWRFNGTNIAGATNDTLVLTNVSPLDAGAYSAFAANSVGSVTSSVATLIVAASAAGILSSPANGTNAFQFGLSGVPGLRYAIEASTNLTDWVPLTTNIAPFNFEDMGVTNFEQRYYRSVWLP